MNVRTLWLALLPLLACSASPPPASAADDTVTRLVVLHTNDTHGGVWARPGRGSAAERASLIANVRRDAAHRGATVLLLDAGDVRTGTYCSDHQQGEPDFQFMDAMGYDAMAVGNHEFDVPFTTLLEQRERVTFAMLSANVFRSSGGLLFPPYALLQRNGMSIAVVGLTPEATGSISTAGGDSRLRFADPRRAARQLVAQLRPRVQVVIVLSHLGLTEDRRIAREVSGVDVIVGGHSHHALVRPEVEEGVVIVQAGSNGRYVGRLDLEVSRRGVKVTEARLLPVSPELPADPVVARLMEQYRCDGGRDHVASLPAAITRDRIEGPGSSSPLANIVADAYRTIGQADVALANRGGLRADLPASDVTEREIHAVLPFDNTLVVLQARGADLYRIVRSMSERGPEGRGYLFPSGMEFHFGPGERVRVIVDGQEVPREQRLTLAVSSFIVGGGDRYGFLRALPVLRRLGPTSGALGTYLRQGTHSAVDRRNRVFWHRRRRASPVGTTPPALPAAQEIGPPSPP